MAAPHNVEFEAAKFLQKLIHESTDEPAKLATKLYVILQHMKASGKENSMPYQVISRAMETVINQHGLDIEALMSSRVPPNSGSHPGEAARVQAAGCSQSVGGAADSKSGMIESDPSRADMFSPNRPPAGPSSMGQDSFQGSVSQRSTRSFDHESPSSMDTRSSNSHSQDRRETGGWEQQGGQKEAKKGSIKRKRSDPSGTEPHGDGSQQPDAHTGMPDMRKERLTSKVEIAGTFPGSPSIDPPAGKGLNDSEPWKQGFFKGAVPHFRERAVPGNLVSPIQGDVAIMPNTASRFDAAGIPHLPINADRLQGGSLSNVGEMGMLRSTPSRDTGKSPASPASAASMPFKEYHLKQLRAQCLVFLAFRNGLPPKRLHLEIALGNIIPKEGPSGSADGAQNQLTADLGKPQTTPESSSIAEGASPEGNPADAAKIEEAPAGFVAAERAPEADPISKESEGAKLIGEKPGPSTDAFLSEEKKHLSSERGSLEAGMQSQETTSSSAFLTPSLKPDTSSVRNPGLHVHGENVQTGGANLAASVFGANKHLKPEIIRWSGTAHNERGQLSASIHHDMGNRISTSTFLSQHESGTQTYQRADSHSPASWKGTDGDLLARNACHVDNGGLEVQARSTLDVSKVVPASETCYTHGGHLSHLDKPSELEESNKLPCAGFAPSPKYTLSEKWIMAHQKRKLVTEQKWMQKLQKADQRIASCFSELKETVSSSEDISAKTRSVIELKKLQLLELQRRLRRNIMNDFFKPIQTDIDRLKSIKKHRIGRRMKHVEKYEQKMKEERQKRIRERQKEFFSEIEVHKERLEDVFKFKRERCKGFNRYVKEFHKRKERTHREKIDRIQREKINLLKINDVEGYLRMVQDAKSDRVNKLLKETEKYLQKLGSKLKEAKSVARQAEDENRNSSIDESSEAAFETEDENDQAKHYKESNEKYYLIAHSVKESITEQPTGLRGGKLREYQMNGLRWLVSLYNNHLNGILADEMGLGKTVQVISLICYLMETKNDRGPFLVVVPSSVLPGWEHELTFWAPGINKIVYAGPPEDRRRLFKESIVHQKFNVLLTTYEYLMNKHDRPKLSKIHWHYVIIDEGHRIKNASCKLNADLKLYHSSHRLLLTGTPLQNNLEELWALLNFLLPNIFNSSEDFSQWFNKPFEGNGDNSADEALLSEEENLLIINRLHQVLRPFVLRRLKHKVENELPEKIERLVRCEASAYQKLLMKRVEDNLGALGMSKARAVHNSVMELRNICNHPYLSQLHAEEVDTLIPKHFLPPIIRLCGKLEMLDRLLPKLKATNHRVLFFSTMTRLLDIMEEYLVWKQYHYLRLDGQTSGQDRGALIEKFNRPDSPFFIFLLSIRAGGVGVNLQAADTVIIFDTDWNPQVDLQAQARAHRIGQKKDVLVLRLETVHTVEEQVRAAAEHKLGVANQSITAGFFDNNTSAEDRREYLESLLRESKKEEAAPVLDDDSLNDILARSESEIDVFEAVDQKRREEEMATWKMLTLDNGGDELEAAPPMPSRLVTDDDLKAFCEAMKKYEVSSPAKAGSSAGVKRKGGGVGGLDTQHYGRGKRAREVRSYEEQWSEEEFEKICQAESPETVKSKEDQMQIMLPSKTSETDSKVELPSQTPQAIPPSLESSSLPEKYSTPPVKRGRGRPRRIPVDASSPGFHPTPTGVRKPERGATPTIVDSTGLDSLDKTAIKKDVTGVDQRENIETSPSSQGVSPLPPSVDGGLQSNLGCTSTASQPKRQGRKGQSVEKNVQMQPGAEMVRRRGRKPKLSAVPYGPVAQVPKSDSSAALTTASGKESGNSVAEKPGGSLPESSDGSASLTVVDSKSTEPLGKQGSLDVASKAVASATDTTFHISDTVPQGQSASFLKSVSSGIAAQATKPNDQAVQQALNASSVTAILPGSSDVRHGDILSPGQGACISESSAGSAAAVVSGTTHHLITPHPVVTGSESALPNPTGVRTAKRQGQKPQSGNEPVRRRGRKPKQTVSSVHDAPIQKPNVDEQLKSPSLMSSPIVTQTGSANPGIGPHVIPVPLIPVVPVSGPVPSSIAPAGSTASMHHLTVGFAPNISASSQPSPLPSGTPDVPFKTPQTAVPVQTQGQKSQTEVVAPRRRGRRKSTVSPAGPDNSGGKDSLSRQSDGKAGAFVERKVIATRSRQTNNSQSQNVQGEAHRSDISVPLTGKDSKSALSYLGSSCGRTKDLPVVYSFSVEGSGSIKATEAGKSPELRVGITEEVKLCRSPADTPPVSCMGKTNVIVLALESNTSAVDSTSINFNNMQGKGESPELEKDKTLSPSVLATNAEASGQFSSAVAATHLEEELCAPPGFDTPRLSMSAVVVKNTLESNDSEKSNLPDAKISSVVLGLESAVQKVQPCDTTSQNFPSDCERELESAVVSGHPDEEMSAPPGFDIPRQSIVEPAVAKSVECDGSQVKQDNFAATQLTKNPASVAANDPGKNVQDAVELSRENFKSPGVAVTSSSSIAVSEPVDGECSHVHDDSLPIIGLAAGDNATESSNMADEVSVQLGLGQTSVLQDNNENLCERGESHVLVDIIPSKNLTDSECVEGEPQDNMQSVKTASPVTEVPDLLNGSKENVRDVGCLNSRQEETFGPDRDPDMELKVDSGESQPYLDSAVSHLEDTKFEKYIAAVEKSPISRTINRESDSDNSGNLKEPITESLTVSTFDDEYLEKAQTEKPSAISSVLEPGNDGSELNALPIISTEYLKSAEEYVAIEDASHKDDGACVSRTDPALDVCDPIGETDASTIYVVADPIGQTDASTIITENTAGPDKDPRVRTKEKTETRKPDMELKVDSVESQPCLGSAVLNFKGAKDEKGIAAVEKRPITTANSESDSNNGSGNLMDPITERPTVPTFHDENLGKAQTEKPTVIPSVPEPEDYENNEVSALSIVRTEDLKSPEENVAIGDASLKDGGACDTETDPKLVVSDPKGQMDASTDNAVADPVGQTNASTYITENTAAPDPFDETAEKAKTEKPCASSCFLQPEVAESTKEIAIPVQTDELKCTKENAEVGCSAKIIDDACDKDVDSVEIDSNDAVADPMKSAFTSLVSTSEACDEGSNFCSLSARNEETSITEASVEAGSVPPKGGKFEVCHVEQSDVGGEQSAEVGSSGQKIDDACEMEIDPDNLKADPLKPADSAIVSISGTCDEGSMQTSTGRNEEESISTASKALVESCPGSLVDSKDEVSHDKQEDAARNEIAEVGGPDEQIDGACAMEIDSEYVVADPVKPADTTIASTSEACDDDSIGIILCPGIDEATAPTINVVSVEPHPVSTDGEKDEACRLKQDDVSGTQPASSDGASDGQAELSVGASDAQPALASISKVDDDIEGSIDGNSESGTGDAQSDPSAVDCDCKVASPSEPVEGAILHGGTVLTESTGQGAEAEVGKSSSTSNAQLGLEDSMGLTVSPEHASTDDDAAAFASIVIEASSREVQESVEVADVDQKDAASDIVRKDDSNSLHDIDNEKSTPEIADNVEGQDIDAEKSTPKTADNVEGQDIDAEKSTPKTADNVDGQDIDDEKSTPKTADNVEGQDIDDEKSTPADNVEGQDIDDEKSTPKTADNVEGQDNDDEKSTPKTTDDVEGQELRSEAEDGDGATDIAQKEDCISLTHNDSEKSASNITNDVIGQESRLQEEADAGATNVAPEDGGISLPNIDDENSAPETTDNVEGQEPRSEAEENDGAADIGKKNEEKSAPTTTQVEESSKQVEESADAAEVGQKDDRVDMQQGVSASDNAPTASSLDPSGDGVKNDSSVVESGKEVTTQVEGNAGAVDVDKDSSSDASQVGDVGVESHDMKE